MIRYKLFKHAVISCLLISACFYGNAKEKISWGYKTLSAGKADVSTGGYLLKRNLGNPGFSPEFSMPIQLIYNSLNEKRGLFGRNWQSPQLESRIFPRKNGAAWSTPWGEKINFFKKDKGAGYYAPYSEWEAKGSKGTWIIKGLKEKDGWKFSYQGSMLRKITAPSERSLSYIFDGKKLVSVEQNGVKFISLSYSDKGLAEKLTINDIPVSLAYSSHEVVSLPENPGENVRKHSYLMLAKIEKGTFPAENFAYNKSGFLNEFSRDKVTETLEIERETLDERLAFFKKRAKLPENKQKKLQPEKRNGRLLKDRLFSYSYKNGDISITNAENQTASYSYNPLRGVLQITGFDGRKSDIFYFRRYDVAYNGKLRLILDNNDRSVLRCRYDKKTGNLIKSSDMLDNEKWYSYNKKGELIQVARSEDDLRKRPFTGIKYDSRGNPKEISSLDKKGKPYYSVNLSWNDSHELTKIKTDERQLTFTYNNFGRIFKRIDTFGRITEYEYDRFNRILSMKAPSGAVVKYSRNDNGQILEIAKYPSSKDKKPVSLVKFSYDKSGSVLAVTDQKNRTRKYVRDKFGRVVKTFAADGSAVEYSFDSLGHLTGVIDQNGNPINFSWNKFGKLNTKTTAEQQLARYVYDENGLLKTITNSKNLSTDREISYNRDEFDRVTSINYGGGKYKTFKYNSYGKILRVEAIEKNMTDFDSHFDKEVRAANFKYDQFNRLVEKTVTHSVVPYKKFASEAKSSKLVYQYGYTKSGKRKSLLVKYPDGSQKITKWDYDKYGRMIAIKDNNNNVTYSYDKNSRLAVKTLPGGLKEFFEYDNEGRLVKKTLIGNLDAKTPIVELCYGYSPDGTLIGRSINGKLQKYEYDQKGQLLAVIDENGDAVEKYKYDLAGNILLKIINGKTTTFSYDQANQLVTSKLSDGTSKTFAYDGAGRMVKEGSKTYSYSWLDKVTKITNNGGKDIEFDYWADGQLAESRSSKSSEKFYWDNLALIKRNDISYTIEPHINGGNAILANNKVLFNDMLGTTLGDVQNGAFSATKTTAFGFANNDNVFFTGKPHVEGLGNVFFFRNYRPNLGKWQTSDPLGYPDGWNNLAYCNNGVITCLDPLGLDVFNLYDKDAANNFGHYAEIVAWSNSDGSVTATYFDYGADGYKSQTITAASGDQAMETVIRALDPTGTRFEGMHHWETTRNESINARSAMIDFVSESYDPAYHNCKHVLDAGLIAAGKSGKFSQESSPFKAFPDETNNMTKWGITDVTSSLNKIQQKIKSELAE